MLPKNTATILQFLFPNSTPLVDWEVHDIAGEILIKNWKLSEPPPTEENILTILKSPEFAVWLEEHTNPILVMRSKAKDEVVTNTPQTLARRADMFVIFNAITNTRQKHNALLDLLVSKGMLTQDEAIQLRFNLKSWAEVILSRNSIITAGQAEV